MDKTIIRNNQKILCNLDLYEEGLNAKFSLFTVCNGYANKYIISAKISGLFSCKESGLWFNPISVEHISGVTNEETLTNEAVLDIFDELTQENN